MNIIEAAKKHSNLLPAEIRNEVMERLAAPPLRMSPAVTPSTTEGKPVIRPPQPPGGMKSMPAKPPVKPQPGRMAPQAPGQNSVPRGIHPNDNAMPMAQWSDESKNWLRDQVWMALENFFSSHNLVDRSIPTEAVNSFLTKVDHELKAMTQAPSYGDKIGPIPSVTNNPKDIEYGLNTPLTGTNLAQRMNDLRQIEAALLELADMADASGRHEDADAIASVLPLTSILKFAQYESAQPYWIMNGRAFEKALLEKRRKKKQDDTKADDQDHYNSWHDSWWEVLEEYQDALMGEHGEFLKYASCTPPGGNMSKKMQEFHEENLETGKDVEEWMEEANEKDQRPEDEKKKDRKKASSFFAIKMAEKVEEGRSPGVAFYETMDEVTSGAYVADILAKIAGTIEDTRVAAEQTGDAESTKKATETAVKVAGFWSGMGDMLGKALSPLEWGAEKAYDQAGELGYGFQGGRRGGGKATELAARIRDMAPLVWGQIKAIRESGTPVASQQFSQNLAKIYPLIDEYSQHANKAGYKLPPPGTLKYLIESQQEIGPAEIEQVAGLWRQFNTWADEDRAREIQKHLSTRQDQIRKKKSPPRWKNRGAPPINWSQDPNMAKQLFDAMKANLPMVRNPMLQRKIKEKMKDLLVAARSNWKIVQAAPLPPKKPMAPVNPAPTVVSPNQVPVNKPNFKGLKVPPLGIRPQTGTAPVAPGQPPVAPVAPAPAPATLPAAANPPAPATPPAAPVGMGKDDELYEHLKAPAVPPVSPPGNMSSMPPEPIDSPANQKATMPPDPIGAEPSSLLDATAPQPGSPFTKDLTLQPNDAAPKPTGPIAPSPQGTPGSGVELGQVRNWMSSNFGTAGAGSFIDAVMKQMEATRSPSGPGAVPGKS